MKAKILSVVVVLIGGGLATLGGEMLSHYVWGDAKDALTSKLTGNKDEKDESEEKED